MKKIREWLGLPPKMRYRFTRSVSASGFVTYATYERKLGEWLYVSDSCYHDKNKAYKAFETICKYGPRFPNEVLEERP